MDVVCSHLLYFVNCQIILNLQFLYPGQQRKTENSLVNQDPFIQRLRGYMQKCMSMQLLSIEGFVVYDKLDMSPSQLYGRKECLNRATPANLRHKALHRVPQAGCRLCLNPFFT